VIFKHSDPEVSLNYLHCSYSRLLAWQRWGSNSTDFLSHSNDLKAAVEIF